jgi:hypothetical protein
MKLAFSHSATQGSLIFKSEALNLEEGALIPQAIKCTMYVNHSIIYVWLNVEL